MVYPSHYAKGFLGYENPALYPYEVVKYSIENAASRVLAHGISHMKNGTTTAASSSISLSDLYASSPVPLARIRPWLQAFDIGATYDAEKIKAQIRASEEGGAVGYMLWSPSNIYASYAE